jgi:hypothetical protein
VRKSAAIEVRCNYRRQKRAELNGESRTLTAQTTPCDEQRMARSTEQQVQELVARFTADLLKVVQEAALASFASAFELKGEIATGGARRGRGRPALTAAKRRRAKGGGKRTVGGKRDPEALATLTEKLGKHVAANGGQDIREIGAALRATTAELALPIKKLLADKKIRKRGQRRSTRYYPA